MSNHLENGFQANDQDTGSTTPVEPVFLAIGVLGKTHGIKGEITMHILTDFPERVKARKVVYLGEDHLPNRIMHVRQHHQKLILAFEGYENTLEVSRLRNAVVYIKAEGLQELPEGEYYHHQLLGMSVFDEKGDLIGELTQILETGANDVYIVIRPDGKEELIPALQSVILDVNIPKKVMVVRLLEWD